MKKSYYAALAAALLLTIPKGVQAIEEVHEFSEVVVSGERESTMPGGKFIRTAEMGPLGDSVDFMDAPVNVISYSDKLIKKSYDPTRAFFNAATNNPSVMVGGCSTDNNVELQIRGIPFNTHDILLDGIPGMMMMQNEPTNYIGSMQIIAGPNAVLTGTGLQQSASGIINFIPKKAEDKPVFDLTETYSSAHFFTHGIDWGQRFGKDNRYGIRINGETYAGHTSIEREDLKGKDLYINVDQRTKNSKSSILVGYDSTVHHGMPEVLKITDENWGAKVTRLPSAKKSVENYLPGWTEMMHRRYVYAAQHEQKLNEHTSAYIKAGFMRRYWPGYLDGKPSLLDDEGNYLLSISPASTMGKTDRRVFMTGLNFNFKTGAVEHKINLGYDYLSQWNYSTYAPADTVTILGNIYTGVFTDPGRPDTPEGVWYNGSRTNERSIVLADSMTMLDGNLKVIAGVRHQSIQTRSFNRTGAQTKSYDKNADTPTFGVVYKTSPNVALYANYAETLGTVSVPSTVKNKDDVMPPVKTKQYEVGGKWDRGNWAMTLSYFHIKQPVGVINIDNYYVMDGETRNQGVEWNIFGQVTPKLHVTGGIMWLDAEYKQTQDGLKDGNRVYGTPRFNAILGLDWQTPLKGLSLNGRMHHFGSSYADSKNRINVPSWTRFDVGAQYDTQIAKVPITFNFMAYNVFDRKYWSTTTTKWGEQGLMLNPGRTFVLSATLHL